VPVGEGARDGSTAVAESVWDEVLDTEHVRVLGTYIERWPRKKGLEEKVLVIVVEPDEASRHRCPKCALPGKVVETDVVRWRTLDVHGKRTFLEYALPRIVCAEHGKITASVPWARPDDRFSRPFEEFAAWKAAHTSWTRAATELRITWEALAGIVARVGADVAAGLDRLEGLRRIGIDEKSWGRGSGKFLVIVTDHDTGRVAWIAQGRDQATVAAFFDALGPERSRLLTHVSADGADWIHPVVRKRAPQASLCLDAFHIVKWANEKLDELRRRTASELRASGRDDQAASIGKGLWALRKKPTNLTGNQKTALAGIAEDNKQLYKGYLLKEQLREALAVKGSDGKRLLRGMIAWAHRCRIPEFVKLAKTLSKYRPTIDNTLEHAVSNGRAEALNAQVNALITRARGFRSAEALMNMVLFVHGGLCPDSPWA
jgi:transposase